MASDQFSLSWDDFHQNMSVGMNSLLKSEDLVDVTIAVEGRYLKAHKMVLSVCSPYFRELFKVTPCKHPIVFLKDVSYVAMSDLLQFMYQGEVQVSQENLTTFIKTGEALKIKGLTDHGNGRSECDKEPDKENKSVTESEETTPISGLKTEPATVVASTSSVERLIQLKEEPCDLDENFKDDPFDDTNEDYSMLEGVDEEPEAGTSADGMVGGQENVLASATQATDATIPKKSKSCYDKEYANFEKWMETNSVKTINDTLMLSYFQELSESYSPNSLWTKFSMLRKQLMVKKKIKSCEKFVQLQGYLKQVQKGYRPKKSKVLTREQVVAFLTEAPDSQYLIHKVALVMGIFGACRRDELVKMKFTDVRDMGTHITVDIPVTETDRGRSFIITEESEMNALNLIRNYISLRSASVTNDRFFLCLKENRCTSLPLDLPKISDIENNEIDGAEALSTVGNLPERSLDRYNKAYNDFKEWCNDKKITKLSENELLLYFEEKSKIRKSSSLWVIYSMMKTTLKVRDNVDISQYSKLVSYLKRLNAGYKPRKTVVLNINQINAFLQDARDKEFLHMKVALIMGVAGGCTSNELCRMSIHDLHIKDDIILVNVPDSYTGTTRQFAIIEPNWISITKKYVSMRPPGQSRFFLSLRNGRLTKQPIGHNMISVMPKKIALFLKLENAHLFTGHCFRKTSATLR